jgi:hypothetical protein
VLYAYEYILPILSKDDLRPYIYIHVTQNDDKYEHETKSSPLPSPLPITATHHQVEYKSDAHRNYSEKDSSQGPTMSESRQISREIKSALQKTTIDLGGNDEYN